MFFDFIIKSMKISMRKGDICNWKCIALYNKINVTKESIRMKGLGGKMRNTVGNILWGLAFIIVGLGFAGNAFGFWNFELFFNGWWTLFIIVPCAISIIQSGPGMGNLIGLCIGSMFMLSAQGFIRNVNVGALIVPVILIIIGLKFIFRNNVIKGKKTDNIQFGQFQSTGSQGSYPDLTAVFGARNVSYQNEVFNGATINAVFGGVELDLRNAIINGDIVINCTTIFGGADILVPSNVYVKVSTVPIFGGVSNKAPAPYGEVSGTIYINATCMFGGVDIK